MGDLEKGPLESFELKWSNAELPDEALLKERVTIILERLS